MKLPTILSVAIATTLSAAALDAQQFLRTGDFYVGANIRIGVLTASGQVSRDFLPGNVAASRMLWDPSRPDTFLNSQVDGSSSSSNGLLVRRVFTGAEEFVTTVVAGPGPFDGVDDMRWDQNGRDVVVLDFSDRLWRIDTVTGAVRTVVNGSAPWSNPGGMTVDPRSGDIYVTDSREDLYRVASGTGGVSFVRSGVPNGLLQIDSGQNKLYYANSRRFGRIDLANPAAPNEDWFGTTTTPGWSDQIVDLAFDQNGDFVFLLTDRRIFRLANTGSVPLGGAVPTLVGSITFSSSSSSVSPQGLAIVGSTTEPYRLTVESVGVLGAFFHLENAPPGFGFGFLLPTRATLLPFDTGPLWGIFPDLLTLSVISRVPTPGDLFAHLSSLPPPIRLPDLSLVSFFGETWDFVGVAFTSNGRYLGRTNAVRVRWN